MENIKFAELNFNIDYKKYSDMNTYDFLHKYFYHHLTKYVHESDSCDYSIKLMRGNDDEYEDIGEFITSYYYYNVHKKNDAYNLEFRQLTPYSKDFLRSCLAKISPDWKELTIVDYVRGNDRIVTEYFVSLYSVINYYITGALLFHDSFFFHSVALQYKEKTIAFSASSGVGKTTHTTFWNEKYGAEILNGDSPIIKIKEGKPYIYGSPWCGTSEITVNKTVLLDAVVMLKQGKENKIRKLSKFEAAMMIFGQIRRPIWDAKFADICLTFAETIANAINVYELECLPNAEAAEICLNGMDEFK